MKFRKLMLALVFLGSIFCVQTGYGQIDSVRYQLRYNTTTCRYDAFLHFKGTATTALQRTQFNSQFSIVVPTGTTVAVAQNFNPLVNNTTYTGTVPLKWTLGSQVSNLNDGKTYISITPTLSPVGQYNNIVNGDSVRIFSLSVSSFAMCGATARIYINGVDPNSSDPGMEGGDFSNGFTMGNILPKYRQNNPQFYPPKPVTSAIPLCNNGLEIDLTATTSTCQAPLTYSWTGPNGYSASTQDVNIPNATEAANGTYLVTVTDALGCSSMRSVIGTAKPTAGPNANACSNSSSTLTGTAPNTGTWTAAATNPPGATLGLTSGGVSSVNFGAAASGVYNFIYTSGPCSDTTQISIVTADAGADPSAVSCFSSGLATLSAVGVGTWSVDPSSSGTAVIANPTSASTTVSNFSVQGTYTLNWTVNGCVDQVTFSVTDNCSCPIGNNNIAPLTTTSFCGNSGSFVLDAQTATPIGGTYLWEYSINGGAFGAAPGGNTSEDYSSTGLTTGVHRLRRVYTITGGAPCSATSNEIVLNVNLVPPVPTNLSGVPNPVCLGNTVNLSANPQVGIIFNWSTANPSAGLGTSSTNLNTMLPTVVGIYTVSVTASAGMCTSFPAITIISAAETPHTPVQADVTSVNPTVCASATGSIAIAGFAPSTSYIVTYTKNGAPQTANIISNAGGTITLTSLTAGTYTNFVVRNTSNCSSGTSTVSVTLTDPSAPSAPAGITATPNPVCLGIPVNLSVTNAPGALYTWSISPTGGGLGSSTTNTNVMNPTTFGSFTVSVIQTVGGCASIPATIGVTVNPSPPTPNAATTIGTSPTSCGGTNGFITLSGYAASTSYTITYLFNGNPITFNGTSNASGVIIIPNLLSGSYSNIRVTNTAGCASGIFAGPVLLTDPNAPAAPSNLTAVPNPSCLGQAVALSVTNNVGAIYAWTVSSLNAGLGISTINTNSMTAIAVGMYTVSVTQNLAGCISVPATVIVNVQGVPPTPTAGSVNGINPTSCGGNNGSITLSGLLGLTAYTINYSKNGSPATATITSSASGVATIANLTAGTYSNFSVLNAAGCASGVFAGPITLSDPGSPASPSNLVANPNPVCSGTIVNLSVTNNPGAIYTWTASSASSGLVASTSSLTSMTSATPGVYTISVTQSVGGCVSSPATTTVNVNPVPVLPVNIAPSNPSVCSGTDGSITISGYLPSTSYTVAYTKNSFPVTFVVVTNASGSMIIPNLTAGIYSGFRITNSSNCSSGTSTATINLSDPNSPPPPSNLTAIPNPACLGQTINLSVTSNPGAAYSWSANNPAAGLVALTTNTTSMTATAAGTYTISVFQNVAGCISTAATLNVVINPIPATPNAGTITPTNPTCDNSNGSITLSNLMSGQVYTINYTRNGVALTVTMTATASGQITISNLDAGSYANFRVTSAQGCSSGTFLGPIVLTSPGLPPAPTGLTTTPDFICLRSVVNMSVTNTVNATYNWTASSANAGIGSTTTNMNWMMATQAGIYTISVTQTINGCTSPANVFALEVRGDCYNPDIDVTWMGVMTEGNVKINDGNALSTYRTATALPGNPSSCLPIVASDGSYTFNCTTTGQYRFNVPACMSTLPASCENVILQITVLDFVPNNPPVVNHDYMRTKSNTPIVINAKANDRCESYPNCSLDNITIVTSPVNGTYNALTGLYTPNNGFIGKDSLKYRVCQLPVVTPTNCSEAWIFIYVIGAANVNVTNAMDDYGQTAFNTTLNVTAANGLKANDRDPESNTQNITPLTQNILGKGNVTINADGSYTFVPATGFSGPVFIPYEICDQGQPIACDKGTLHLLVERFNAVGAIGNFVWHDINGNGIQDAIEPGVSNVKVFLYDEAQNQVATTTTTITGAYQFDNVAAGNYFLKFQAPSSYSFINYGQGSDRAKDSDVTNQYGAGTTSFLTLLPGQQELTYDAGLYICSNVGDRVWYDTDKDDVWDQNENGINALEVSIWRKYGSTWAIYSSMETSIKPGTPSDDGWFQFCVPPGEYYISFDIPPIQLVAALPNRGGNPMIDSDITGTFGTGTTRSFTLLSGQTKLDIGAGYYPMATTGNLVWKDTNINGIQDSGEPPVANVNVQVIDAVTHEKLGESLTNASGVYLVEYLQKKDVYLKFEVPPGFASTVPLATIDAMDSDVDNTYGPNTTRKISLLPGTSHNNIDLGLMFAPLPVNWQYINAKRIKATHKVAWGTAQEQNTNYFEVERKINNQGDFVVISDKIKAAGNSATVTEYIWDDLDTKKVGTYYYRIKQVDLDGKISHSEVVSVLNKGDISIELYPSPAVSESFVKLNLVDFSKVQIELFDGLGKLIAITHPTQVMHAGEHILPINIAPLPNGVYVVYVNVDGEIKKMKLIKID